MCVCVCVCVRERERERERERLRERVHANMYGCVNNAILSANSWANWFL